MRPFYWLVVVLFAFLTACSSDLKPVPTALGPANQINIVCDQSVWDGAVGDTIRYYFESAYPMMPQPEPYFTIRHFKAEEIQGSPLLRELRTYMIVADLNDKDSPTTKMAMADLGEEKVRKAKELRDFNNSVGRNKWAKGQLLIYIFAQNRERLAEALKESFSAAANRVLDHDKPLLDATVYLGGAQNSLNNTLLEKYGIQVQIPGDYQLALEDDKSTWLRKNTDDIFYNLIFYKKPYTDETQLSTEAVQTLRDSIGRYLVSSPNPGSYMTTNDVDLPVYARQYNRNNVFTTELRGIWEMENDFMGGPFFSYAMLSPDKKTILFVDAFVMAPGKDKKIHMQYLDHIVSTIKFL